MSKKFAPLGAVISLAWASAAAGATYADGSVIGFVDVTTTSTLEFGDRPITRLIDQVGLSNQFVSGVTPFKQFVGSTFGGVDGGGGRVGALTPFPVNFDFSFDDIYQIDAIGVINAGGGLASLQDFALYTSDDASFSDPTLLGAYSPLWFGSTYTFVASFQPVNTRYVRLTALSNDGWPSSVRLDEVFARAFPSPVPEPTTWAMTIIGFGLAGAALRRRPSVPAPG